MCELLFVICLAATNLKLEFSRPYKYENDTFILRFMNLSKFLIFELIIEIENSTFCYVLKINTFHIII